MKLTQIVFGLTFLLSPYQAIAINNNPKQQQSQELNKAVPPHAGSMVMIKSQSKDENIQMENLDDQTPGDSEDPVAKAMDDFKSTQDQLIKINEMVFAKKQPVGALALAKVAMPNKKVAAPVEPPKAAPAVPVKVEPEHREGYYSNPAPAPSQQAIAVIPSDFKSIKSETKIAKVQAKQETIAEDKPELFQSRFSDSMFDTQKAVKKTLDVVHEQANRKAHPFSGLFGGVNQASDLFKTIETKVDLPSSEFRAVAAPAKSVEQKLGESMSKAILHQSTLSTTAETKSDAILKTDKNLQELLNSVDAAAKSLSDSLNTVDKVVNTTVAESEKEKKADAPIALVSGPQPAQVAAQQPKPAAVSDQAPALTQNNSSSSAKAESKDDKIRVLPVAKMTAKSSVVAQQALSQQESTDKTNKKDHEHTKNDDIPKRKTHWFRGILNSIGNAFARLFSFFK